jgi:hypothetical protein
MKLAGLFGLVAAYLPYALALIALFIAPPGKKKVIVSVPHDIEGALRLLTDPEVQKAINVGIAIAEETKKLTGDEKKEYALAYLKKWLLANAKEYTSVPDFVLNFAIEKIFLELGGLKRK